jgi:hypothetical protein
MMINRMDSIKTIGPISLFWFPALLVPYFRDFGSAKKMNKTIGGKLMGLKRAP